MKKVYLLLYFSILAVGLSSCFSPKTLINNLNSNSSSLVYLKDSKISNNKIATSLKVGEVKLSPNAIGERSEVIVNENWCVPAIVVNIWKAKATCYAGQTLMTENIADFYKQSLTEEIYRSGVFISSDSLPDYTLNVKIEEVKTVGPYTVNGHIIFAFYFFAWGESQYAGPGLSDVFITYELTKDNQVVYSNTCRASRNTQQIANTYGNVDKLQKDYAISMVEATSLNFKSTIESLVNDLNLFILQNQN